MADWAAAWRSAIAAAQAELRPALDRIRGMFPWRVPDEYGRDARAILYGEAIAKGVRPKLFALSAAALLLLLIACGNVANLLLARAVHREREFAMREALGAPRSRLLRQLMAENFVLLVAGGVAGLVAAAVILKALPLLLPNDTPRLHEIVPDLNLLLVAACSMLITVVFFSAAPMIRWSWLRRESLAGRATTAPKRASGLSLALIGFELALATVLLIGAGLMGRTLWQLAQVDSGVHAPGVVVAKNFCRSHPLRKTGALLGAAPGFEPDVDRRAGGAERQLVEFRSARQGVFGSFSRYSRTIPHPRALQLSCCGRSRLRLDIFRRSASR